MSQLEAGIQTAKGSPPTEQKKPSYSPAGINASSMGSSAVPQGNQLGDKETKLRLVLLLYTCKNCLGIVKSPSLGFFYFVIVRTHSKSSYFRFSQGIHHSCGFAFVSLLFSPRFFFFLMFPPKEQNLISPPPSPLTSHYDTPGCLQRNLSILSKDKAEQDH